MLTKEELKNPEFSYFIGAVQGDGSYGKYVDRTKGKFRTTLSLNANDLEMVGKCADIFNFSFERNVSIGKRKNDKTLGFSTTVNSLVTIFSELRIDFSDPPKPPNWITQNIKPFGPYMAGLIDSDGSVAVKRKKYPQCAIRIISGYRQEQLKIVVERMLNCKSSIEETGQFVKEWENWYPAFRLSFLVSKKNWKIIEKNVLPFITLSRKRIKIEHYLKKFAS